MSGEADTVLTAREAMQVRRLTIVLTVVGFFFFAEFAGGVVAGSNVLKTDALHLLMDCVALAASLLAMRLAVRKPTARFTFGLRRAEPVAALINAALVLIATVEIVHEALESFNTGAIPNARIMLPVSAVALVVNGFCAWLLHGAMGHHGHGHDHGAHSHGADDHGGHEHGGHRNHGHDHHDHPHHSHDDEHDHGGHCHSHDGGSHDPGDFRHGNGTAASHRRSAHTGESTQGKALAHGHGHDHELNLRGAWLHLMGDALGSLMALGAAVVIWFKGPRQVDVIASLVVASIIAIGAVRLIRDALVVLLEAAPSHLPVEKVRAILSGQPGINEVVSLHVWTLGGGHHVVIGHVLAEDATVGARASAHLKKALGLQYVTIQVDKPPAG